MSDENFTLNDEFVEQHGLSEEQVSAITNHVSKEFVPEVKKTWAEQTNGGLEAMLDGVSKYAIEKTGVDIQRERGEKWGDFLNRLSDTKLESDKASLEEERKQLQEKLKNFKGSDEVKAQLEELQTKNDGLLKQVAELEKLKGYDEKYETASSELSKFKKEVAYSKVRPNFPESVNKYEADHKWNEFKSKIEDKYNIEVVDDKAIAIDKENEHRRFDLKELVDADEGLKALATGRQQGGTGADPADPIEVDDLPFTLKKGMDSTDVSKLVQEHLVKKLGSTTHKDYTSEFRKLYAKAKEALSQAA